MIWPLLALSVHAHPGADAHAAPSCADLLLRVEALTGEGRLVEARAALPEARDCDPDVADLARAALDLAEGRPDLARLDALVARSPGPPTWLARADACDALDRPDAAARDRLAALEVLDAPPPGLFLATARALARAGRPAEALAVIDRGLAACGAVSALVVAGVELAAPDEALRRLDALPVQPRNLALRAEVFDRAGQPDAARAARAEALRLARTVRPSPARDALIRALEDAL